MGERFLLRVAIVASTLAVAVPGNGAAQPTTLRVGWPGLFGTLDPMRADDMWAQANAGLLFDQLYTYDYLARPVRLVPLAAESLPTTSPDGREITVRIRPGIRFTSHSAFGNKQRELVASDFVYSMKRLVDPAVRSPSAALIAGRIEGLDEWAKKAAPRATSAHYDAPVAGLTALDARTVRLRLVRPDRDFVYMLASPTLSIVPREVIDADANVFAQRPTGSGPYVVRDFQPNARLVLERNPSYRDVRWGDLAARQPEEPAWASALRTRRFPLADRIELTEIAERTTGILSLEQGRIDVWPINDGASIVNGRLAPRLEQAGLALVHGWDATADFLLFNMRDREIGGTSPERIALRRAIAMAIDDADYIRIFANGSGVVGRHAVPPGIGGHDPAYRNPNGYDPVLANGLLDRFGFRRGSDGYRADPGRRPLTLSVLVSTTSRGRQWAEFVKRSLDAIGVRASFETEQLGDRMGRIGRCAFQLTTMNWGLDWPDGSNLMFAFHGSALGSVGLSCMQDAEFDAAYDKLATTAPGSERDALFRRMTERLDHLMPARLLPTGELHIGTSARVRGLVAHPAIMAPFAFVDVVPAAPRTR